MNRLFAIAVLAFLAFSLLSGAALAAFSPATPGGYYISQPPPPVHQAY